MKLTLQVTFSRLSNGMWIYANINNKVYVTMISDQYRRSTTLSLKSINYSTFSLNILFLPKSPVVLELIPFINILIRLSLIGEKLMRNRTVTHKNQKLLHETHSED